jgi:AcrR family transcriptional regulator
LRDEHRDATRAAVLARARALFSAHGYNATSLEQIARAARVTKGAVYHHFDGKAELFRSVYEELAAELEAGLAERITHTTDPAQKAMAAITLLFESADERDVRVILFRDGPAVLGEECRQIDQRQFLGLIRELLDELAGVKLLVGVDTELLARLLLSVLIEASVLLGNADDVERTRAALRVLLGRMLAGVIDGG